MTSCAGWTSARMTYIPKPFRMMELLSRIRALLRRSGGANDGRMEEYRVGQSVCQPDPPRGARWTARTIVLTLKGV